MNLLRLIQAATSGGLKLHTGQWAEDVLTRKLLAKKGVYLDLGAYHPFKHSNTAGLWLKGWSGANVDANPNSIRLFEKIRNKDINIWAAVLPSEQIPKNNEIILSVPDTRDNRHGISAKGSCQPEIIHARGMKEKISVPAYSVAGILQKTNFNNIDYLNIDIEGMDEAVLKEFDFDKYRPFIVTCEDYANNIHELVCSGISTFMLSKGYEFVARAGLTSIFKISK